MRQTDWQEKKRDTDEGNTMDELRCKMQLIMAPRIASGVSDQKEVISFFCGSDKFVVSIAKSFIYRIIEVSRFSMAAFTSSCAKRIGKPGLGKSDTSRSLGTYGCMFVQKIGKSTVIQINIVTKRLRWIGNQVCLLEIIQECSVVNRMEMTEGTSLWWWQGIWRDAEV